MRTKVRFKYSDDSKSAKYKEGDYGLIDGYVGDTSNQYAVVIVNKKLVIVHLHELEVLDDNTVIPIPDSNKFPPLEEINEMASKYDLGPNYNQMPGFYAAIYWVNEWLKKRNLI